jgi:hypothetical protein
MSTLKEKFGKFALSKAQERQIYGGHCPKHLSEDWCHSYWAEQLRGRLCNN